MTTGLTELYRFRELLWIWTLREVSIRYKQAFFGPAWAILQPLGMMLAFTLVATFLRGFIDSGGVPYPIFYYSALLPWTFFTGSVGQAAPSLISNMNLVTKTYFPREILPVAKIGASFFDFVVASVVFVIMMLIYQVPFSGTIIWLPLLLLVQIILILGLSLLTSSITVIFRDVRFLVPMTLQLLLFVSPIIYPASLVPDNIRPLYMILNPMAGLIDSYRRVILFNQPPGEYVLSAAVIAVVLFFSGYFVFKRLEKSFADII